MYPSDYSHTSSTHELLLMLFRSEIGLIAVTHPTVQVQAINDQFKNLQTKIVEGLKSVMPNFALAFYLQDGSVAGQVPFTYVDDARVFKELYTEFNRHSEDRVLGQHVYPLIGRMIWLHPGLKQVVTKLLAEHITLYGNAVANRIYRQLESFDLCEIVPELRSLHAAPNTTEPS